MTALKARFHFALTSDLSALSVTHDVEALLGYGPDDFLSGRVSLRHRIHPGDQDIAEVLFAPDIQAPSGTFNLRVRHAHGHICCLKAVFEKRLDDDNGVVIDLELQDAKALSRTMEDIAAMSNGKAIMENTDDFIYFKDRNHVFTGASQSLVALCSPAEHWTDLLGQTDYDVFPEKYADHYYRLEKEVFSRMEAVQEVQEFRTRDGSKGWVDNRKYPIRNDKGEIVGLYGVARDITDRMQTEFALRESQKRLQLALDASRQDWFELDVQTGASSTGKNNAKMLGYTPDEYQPSLEFWRESIHPDDRAAVLDAYQQSIETGQTAELVYRRQTKSGAWIWVSSIGQVVERDAQGKALKMTGTHMDVTERKQADIKLRLAASVFTNMHEGIMITDAANVIVDVNPGFTRITGYSREDVIGKGPRFFKVGRQNAAFFSKLWTTLREHDLWRGEIWNQRKNGEKYAAMLSVSAIRDERGTLQHYISVFSDISQMKEHEADLFRIAHYDPLTGVPNRRLLADRIEQAIARCQRSGKLLAVCYLDLDGFKAINDQLGHAQGDQLLITITKRMQTMLRAHDTIARLGGDEFVLLLSDLSQLDECYFVLDRVLGEIRAPVTLEGNEYAVSASIGVALYPPDEADADTLLRHADQAMYRAKESGKNRYQLFALK